MPNGLPLLTYLWLKLKAVIFRLLVGLLRYRLELYGEAFIRPTRQFTVPSSAISRKHIRMNEYRPPGLSKDKRPVYINFHGSGFVFALFGLDSQFCSYIASSLNCIVLDADYSKAPEYPFPAAYHDVEDVLEYVLSSPQFYDTSRVAVGGFSAGANLALCVSGCSPIAKDRLAGVVAFYPVSDFRKSGEEMDKELPPLDPNIRFPGDRMAPELLQFFTDCYIPPSQNKSDPRLSPVLMDPSSLPPILIINAEHDTLRPDTEIFAKKVQDAGRMVVMKTMYGVGHGFDHAVPGFTDKSKKEAYASVVQFLGDRFGVSSY